MKFTKLLFLTLALLTTVAVADEDVAYAKFSLSGKEVIAYKLDEVKSSATTLDAFAVEVAPKLNTYTAATGFEACASLCKAADGTYRATIITVKAHAFCPVIAEDGCDDGATYTGHDIHSHIQATRYVPNDIDRLVLLRHYGANEFVFTRPGFSDGDLSIPGGYLATKKGVQYEDGPGKTRTIAEF